MQKTMLILSGFLLLSVNVYSQQIISGTKTPGSFSLKHFSIYYDTNDFELVRKSALLLQSDIEKVTGKKLPLVNSISPADKNVIVVGTLTHAAFIKELVSAKKLMPENAADKWEAYNIHSIKTTAGQNLLVVAGSDRRGTAYGVFELSRQMGVSPWYWWADVPVKKQADLYINNKASVSDAPKVKYRGIFINDEAPAFSHWATEKFGGINHHVYEKVFELILRLKGNYLWPAMWGNAFNDDDTLNPIKAHEWGIVMGTSHHEPMMRSQQEWKRYGSGKWNYDSNATVLKAFWQKGIENMGDHESIVTLAMRGDGDEPMSDETATELLEKIVKDQRTIIEDVTKKPAGATPQLWALYKEVQEYYDKGMRVPDDVTLLLCDDNWGHLRKLPTANEPPRKGGYGIYYHFDYVGAPRNYKWLNTNQVAKIWEQMHLAWEYNARQIWVVNVGDIKPMEVPLSFFLDYAWNPEEITAKDLLTYTTQWCAAQFGNKHSKEIAHIITRYTQYNARRKPELLNENTYSFNYNEWATVVRAYNDILKRANAINALLPEEYKDAFFQLVLHPVWASANLNELYYNVALNKQAYEKKWVIANMYADNVKRLYHNDSLITLQYHTLNGGKWNHMMSQTHIGYTYWQQPPVQKMPEVYYVTPDSVQPQKHSPANNPARATVPKSTKGPVFYEEEATGVAIEAEHTTRRLNTNGISWTVIPGLGRTLSAITPLPVTAATQQPAGNAPRLEYDFYTISKGDFSVEAYFSPTLNFHHKPGGMKYAVSIDNEAPRIMSVNANDTITYTSVWNKWVAENIIIKTTQHKIMKPGKHTLRYWMVDPAVVLEKFVINFGKSRPAYLGPPETRAK